MANTFNRPPLQLLQRLTIKIPNRDREGAFTQGSSPCESLPNGRGSVLREEAGVARQVATLLRKDSLDEGGVDAAFDECRVAEDVLVDRLGGEDAVDA